MVLRMILLLAAMRLVASTRSFPAAALALGAASFAFLVRDWSTHQTGASRVSQDSVAPAISGATLCLATINLTPPAAIVVRICLILVAGGLSIWAAWRYYASPSPTG